MNTIVRRALVASIMALTLFALLAVAQDMPRSTKEAIKGETSTTTEQLSGTVLAVEGNQLAVRMASGELRTFNVPESRRFMIDGKELKASELKPGTKLTADITKTTTSVTDRTTTVGTGKVWFVNGNNVIVTLPNNENRVFKVDDNYRFMVGGKQASVHELKKGMVISAQRIVEEPRTEFASNTVVTGHAPPPPKAEMAKAEPQPTPTPAPAPAAPAPAPSQAAADRAAPQAPPEEPMPARLPKTGSLIPLAGMAGLLLTATSFALRKMRRP